MRRTGSIKFYLAATAALIVFVAYLPALQNEFVHWDDTPYVVDNLHIRSFDAAFFRWAFFDFHASYWAPLTWISFAMDYAVWGLNPLGYHLMNTILHAANTAVVMLLILRLLEIAKARRTQAGRSEFLPERTMLIAAGITGLLFGLHPLRVESVAWIAERKDLLCALFFLLSINTYLKYAGSREAGVGSQTSGSGIESRGPGVIGENGPVHKKFIFNKHYLLALGYFILALMSKPMAITLPLVLLILDWYPLNRTRSLKTFWKTAVEKLPFIALSLLSALLTILAAKAAGPLQSLESLPLSIRMLVGTRSLVAYLWKMIFPLNLVPFYPYPEEVSLLSIEYVLPLILVTGITLFCILIAKKHALWLAAWSYYVVTLVPVLGIVQAGDQSMADRFTYLPGLGPILVTGLGVAWIFGTMNTLKRPSRGLTIAAIAITFIAFIFLFLLTFKQISVWRNDLVLWTYIIEKEPGVSFAYFNRGMIYGKMGQFGKALDDLDKAIALDQDDPQMLITHGFTCIQVGQVERGLSDFKRACDLGSDFGCRAAQSYGKDGLQ